MTNFITYKATIGRIPCAKGRTLLAMVQAWLLSQAKQTLLGKMYGKQFASHGAEANSHLSKPHKNTSFQRQERINEA